MAAYILIFLIAAGLVWLAIRFQIWIIKTAIKEALREYDAEKRSGHTYYGS